MSTDKKRGNSVNRRPFLMKSHWRVYYDERHDRDYFSNNESMVVTWDCPPELEKEYAIIRGEHPTGLPPMTAEEAAVHITALRAAEIRQKLKSQNQSYDPKKSMNFSKMTARGTDLGYKPASTNLFVNSGSDGMVSGVSNLSVSATVTPTNSTSTTPMARTPSYLQPSTPSYIQPTTPVGMISRSNSAVSPLPGTSTTPSLPNSIAAAPISTNTTTVPPLPNSVASTPTSTTSNSVPPLPYSISMTQTTSSSEHTPATTSNVPPLPNTIANNPIHTPTNSSSLPPPLPNSSVTTTAPPPLPNSHTNVTSTPPPLPVTTNTNTNLDNNSNPTQDFSTLAAVIATAAANNFTSTNTSSDTSTTVLQSTPSDNYSVNSDYPERHSTSITAATTSQTNDSKSKTRYIGTVGNYHLYHDLNTDKAFFYEASTGVTSWDPPAEHEKAFKEMLEAYVDECEKEEEESNSNSNVVNLPEPVINENTNATNGLPSGKKPSRRFSTLNLSAGAPNTNANLLYHYLPNSIIVSIDPTLYPANLFPLPMSKQGTVRVKGTGLLKPWKDKLFTVSDGLLRMFEPNTNSTTPLYIGSLLSIETYVGERAPYKYNYRTWTFAMNNITGVGTLENFNAATELVPVEWSTNDPAEADLWAQVMVRNGAIDSRYCYNPNLLATKEGVKEDILNREMLLMSPISGKRKQNGLYYDDKPLCGYQPSPIPVCMNKKKLSTPQYLLIFANRLEIYSTYERALAACRLHDTAPLLLAKRDKEKWKRESVYYYTKGISVSSKTVVIDGNQEIEVTVDFPGDHLNKPQVISFLCFGCIGLSGEICNTSSTSVNGAPTNNGVVTPAVVKNNINAGISVPYNTAGNLVTALHTIFNTCYAPITECDVKSAICRSAHPVPLVLHWSLSYLSLSHNLTEQGILRLAGGKQTIEDSIALFAHGTIPPVLQDVNSMAGVMKAYIRQLKHCLIPISFHQDFLKHDCKKVGAGATKESRGERIDELYQVIESIPAANRLVLKLILYYLNKLYKQASVNLMNSNNLAIVMSPNLFREDLSQINDVDTNISGSSPAPTSPSHPAFSLSSLSDLANLSGGSSSAEKEAVTLVMIEHLEDVVDMY